MSTLLTSRPQGTTPRADARLSTRVAARVIDVLLCSAVVGPLAAVSAEPDPHPPGASAIWPVWLIVVSFVVPVAYESVMVRWFDATAGKLLFHLRVVTLDGGRPALLRIVVRSVLSWIWVGALFTALRIGDVFQLVCAAAGGVVVLSVWLSRSHRGLNDLVAATRVETLRPR